MTAPIFQMGGVRFYQGPQPVTPLAPSQPVPIHSYHGHLTTNEDLDRLSPKVQGLGGTWLGIGAMQNVDLALRSGCSGIVLADFDPLVAMVMALFLAEAPHMRDVSQWVEVGAQIATNPLPFLDLAPEEWRPALGSTLAYLKQSDGCRKDLSDLLRFCSRRFDSGRFAALQTMVADGRVAVVYGNFFAEGMGELLGHVLSVYEDPVRVVYLTNALDWIALRHTEQLGSQMTHLRRILTGPRIDPQGRFLLTTLGTGLGSPETCLPIHEAAELAGRHQGDMRAFIGAAMASRTGEERPLIPIGARLVRISPPNFGIEAVPHFKAVFYPDTEFVKQILGAVLPPEGLIKGHHSVLVLGCGAGYEAAVLAKQTGATVHATDIQYSAVNNTNATARYLGMADQIHAWASDGFNEVRGRYDFILFNAPLPIQGHEGNVNTCDPGGRLLTRILQELPDHLTPGGALYLMSFPNIGHLLPPTLTSEVVREFEAGEPPYTFNFAIHRVTATP